MTMHHSVLLVASVLLLLILSGHSQFLDQDPDPDFDPSLELFSPSNDFFIDDPQPEISSNLDDPQTELSSNLDDPQPEVSSNLDDLPYPYFLADASECNSASNGSPNKIRARQNNACPVPNDEQETIPRMPSADRDRVINQLLGPLDNSVDQTGETAKKNFVNTLCLASSINRQTIPVCTSGLEDDVYPNALGGVNLRNCELLNLNNMRTCIYPKSITCCAEYEVETPILLVLAGGPFLQDTFSWGYDCTNF